MVLTEFLRLSGCIAWGSCQNQKADSESGSLGWDGDCVSSTLPGGAKASGSRNSCPKWSQTKACSPHPHPQCPFLVEARRGEGRGEASCGVPMCPKTFQRLGPCFGVNLLPPGSASRNGCKATSHPLANQQTLPVADGELCLAMRASWRSALSSQRPCPGPQLTSPSPWCRVP